MRGSQLARVLMLDADGVLVHPAPNFARNEALEGVVEAVRAAISPSQREALGTGHADMLDVLRVVGGGPVEEIAAYWLARDTHIDPAMLAAVDALRRGGTRVYLATNQDSRRAEYLWSTLGLVDHFDGLLASSLLGVRKPDAAYFDAAAATAGVIAADLVFIDDSEPNITAARQAGWRAAHWTSDLTLEAAIAAAH